MRKFKYYTLFTIFILTISLVGSVQAQIPNPIENSIYYSVEEALQAKSARQLNLRDQHLFFVPSELQNLKELEFLNLMRNNISKWDGEISN